MRDDLGETRRAITGLPGRPQERYGLGRVADIVARQPIEFGVHMRGDDLRQDAAQGERERQAAGQGGERVAAVRIRGGAKVVGEQSDLAAALGRGCQPVEQFGETLHQSASSSKPTSASARPLRPMSVSWRTSASSRPWVTQTSDAPVSRMVATSSGQSA